MSDIDLDLGCTRQLIERGQDAGLLRNELAYVLATACWETAWTMEPVREAYWLSEEWREENLSYYPWYGRGFVQLTWEENYSRADRELNLGGMLLDDPDTALEPDVAADVIVLGMVEGWFTGLRLSDFINLEHSDYLGARAIINGSDHAADIATLAAEYEAALLAEGYGVDDDAPVIPPGPPEPAREIPVAALLAVLTQASSVIADQGARLERLEGWAKSYGVADA